ncbi:MAG TPA: hypothetical protein VLV18_11260 [Terriglobales bacterium]|nr:hypothetical protein [Terriglobales bacterium]
MEEHKIETPPEWGGIIPTHVFLEEGKRLVDEAEKRSVPLRLLGGVAIRIHCSEFLDFAKKLMRLGEGQQEYTDLDFMSYMKCRKSMADFFADMAYDKRRTTMSSAATQRQIFFHPKGWFYVDVFYDKLLAANHPLDFRKRLELDSPTITPADLLLEKLQIVFPGEKDVKDLLLLLRAHEISGDEETNKINGEFIAKTLASDWGFWYTVTTNLTGLKQHTESASTLTEEEKRLIVSRVDELRLCIDQEPKSTGWKMRSAIGTRKQWYNPVETSQTVGEFGIWKLRETK